MNDNSFFGIVNNGLKEIATAVVKDEGQEYNFDFLEETNVIVFLLDVWDELKYCLSNEKSLIEQKIEKEHPDVTYVTEKQKIIKKGYYDIFEKLIKLFDDSNDEREYYFYFSSSNPSKSEITKGINYIYNSLYYRDSFKSNDNTDFIEIDERKFDNYNNNYSLQVEILTNEEPEQWSSIASFINNLDENSAEYKKMFHINGKDTVSYFKYKVKGRYVNENNDTINDEDAFVDLLLSIKDSFSENNNINYYENKLKKYFYKELLERYRTKKIDEEFQQVINYKEDNNILSFEDVLPKCWNLLNGVSGNLINPRIIETARKYDNKDVVNCYLPFDMLSFNKNYITLYVKKNYFNNLDRVFFEYESFDSYFTNLKAKLNEYAKKFSSGMIVSEKIDTDYGVAERNVSYNPFKNYLKLLEDSDFFALQKQNASKKIVDYVYLLLGNININIENNTEQVQEQIQEQIKTIFNKSYIVRDFIIDSNPISGIDFSDDNYVKLNLVVNGANFEAEIGKILDIEGSIKIHNLQLELRDNRVSNSVSSELIDRNKYGDAIDFDSAFDDREISVVLKTIDKTNYNLENLPNIHNSIVSTIKKENNELVIDATNFYKDYSIEQMKYISFIFAETDEEYLFPVKDIKVIKSYENRAELLVEEETNLPTLDGFNLINDGIANNFPTATLSKTADKKLVMNIDINNKFSVINNDIVLNKIGETNEINDDDYELELNDSDIKINEYDDFVPSVEKKIILKQYDSNNDEVNVSSFCKTINEEEKTIIITGFIQDEGHNYYS